MFVSLYIPSYKTINILNWCNYCRLILKPDKMIRSTTIKANDNTIKVLHKMASDKEAHRKTVIALIKEKAKK
jgi:hypothetical protein